MSRVEHNINFKDIPGEHVRFKNFSGSEQPPYNPAGARNFCIDILDDEFATELSDEGWNVKFDTKEREDGRQYPPNLKINVKYSDVGRPRVMMEQTQSNGEVKQIWLDQNTIGDLDDMEIIRIKEIEIRPYNYDVRGSQGVSAYLKAMRVEVARDMFAD